MKQPPFDVVVIDNVDVVRMGLMTMQFTHGQIVRSVRTYADVSEVDFNEPGPDVVVLDYWLGRDDQASLEHIKRLSSWSGGVVLYTSEEAPARLREALRRGVVGLCLKNDGADALANAIIEAGTGQFSCSGPIARAIANDDALKGRLTPAEITVLRAHATGLTAEQIADRLHIATSTVRTHIEAIRRRYSEATGEKVNGVRMVQEGLRDGWIDPPRASKDPEND